MTWPWNVAIISRRFFYLAKQPWLKVTWGIAPPFLSQHIDDGHDAQLGSTITAPALFVRDCNQGSTVFAYSTVDLLSSRINRTFLYKNIRKNLEISSRILHHCTTTTTVQPRLDKRSKAGKKKTAIIIRARSIFHAGEFPYPNCNCNEGIFYFCCIHH